MSFLQRHQPPSKLTKSTGASLQGVAYIVKSDTINCLQVHSCGFSSTLKHIRKNWSTSWGEERGEERGWGQGKARWQQPGGKDSAFSDDLNGQIWFKKVNENSLIWQKLFSMSCNSINPGLAFTRRMKWKAEYGIRFVCYSWSHCELLL